MTKKKDTPKETPIPWEDLNASLKKTFRYLLRDLILRLRAQHLANGGNPRTHWDRIQAVIVSQARQCGSLRQWVTRTLKRLQVESPGSSLSLAIEHLLSQAEAIPLMSPSQRERFVLSMLSEEGAYLMASARVKADERKAWREEMQKSKQTDSAEEPEEETISEDTAQAIAALQELAAIAEQHKEKENRT